MKSIIQYSLPISFCLLFGSSCQQEEGTTPITPTVPDTSTKLKSMSNYYYSTSGIADEQFVFSYDEKGRLSAYDRYVPDNEGNDMRHQLHFSLEYAAGLNSTYKVIVWEIGDGKPDVIVGRRRVSRDDNSNFVRDIIYDESGDKVLHERIYSRAEGGYTVLVRQWIEDYNQYGVTKVGYETDADGNVTKKKIYTSHFEGTNVEEQVAYEYVLTHDSNPNPLYNLTPYFVGFNSLNRYADSESKHNVVTLTPQDCEGEECISTFTYTYENGLVTEANPGGYLLYKRTFEYY